MDRYFLGIDIGTSSIKVILLEKNGTAAAFSCGDYVIVRPDRDHWQIPLPGLWEALTKVLSDISRKADLSKVAGIGISCLCPALVALNGENEALYDAIIYLDRRSKEEAKAITDAIGEEKLFEITANPTMAGAISSTSLLWLKNNEPEIYEKTKLFGHLNSWLGAQLTGKVYMDPSNASYTGLFETSLGGTWSQEICSKLGIETDKLPPIIQSYEKCGTLRNEVFERFGLPTGIPVVIGASDTTCTALACSAVNDGDTFLSLGSTNVLTVVTDKPIFCKEFLNRCHINKGQWLYQGAMSNVGAMLDWVSSRFAPERRREAEAAGKNAIAFFEQIASEVSPGAGGIVFLPYLSGERCPVWDAEATGLFYGITTDTTQDDFIRAVMESYGYSLRQVIEIAEKLRGNHISEIRTVGGGARSIFGTALRSDISNRIISVVDETETAAIGAAMLAGIGAGDYKDIDDACSYVKIRKGRKDRPTDDKTAREIYEKRYLTYKQLYSAEKAVQHAVRLNK